MKYSRKEIWQHNGFLGTVIFAQKGLQRIIQSKTATPIAKTTARNIIDDLDDLYKLLKVKV
jgi:CxxC motif-containing protein